MLKYVPEKEGATCSLNSESTLIYTIEYGDVSKCEITTPGPKFRRYIGTDIVIMGDLLSTDEVYLTDFGYISEEIRAWCCIILSEDHPGKGIILKYPIMTGRNADWVECILDERMLEMENEMKNAPTPKRIPAEGSRASFLRYVSSPKGYSIMPKSYRLRRYDGDDCLLIGQQRLKTGCHMYTRLATVFEEGTEWLCVLIGLQTLGPWAVLYYDNPKKLKKDWVRSYIQEPVSDSMPIGEEGKDVEATELPKTDDLVENPSHYVKNGVECINWIQQALTPEEFRGYLKGNVLKYLWRCEGKGAPVMDIRKAGKYCRFLDNLASNGKADGNE